MRSAAVPAAVQRASRPLRTAADKTTALQAVPHSRLARRILLPSRRPPSLAPNPL